MTNSNIRKLYAQATSSNISDILKLKDNFSNLSAKKIKEIQRIINDKDKVRSQLNMTTKGLSKKQIIVPMSKVNINNILILVNEHAANINRALKNVKSNILVNFIYLDKLGITITSNLVVSQLDLLVIERYMKSINNVSSDNVQIPQLPQLKLCLKIISILFFIEDTNTPIMLDNIKAIIKASHIFNDLTLTSKSRVIKAFPKSNMTVIWIDVWDTQSRKNGKILINRYFNIRRYIATIHGANINLAIPQYKNCQKQEHSTFMCRIQDSNCAKYNELHKSEYYCQFTWYCKTNFKTNPTRLETKQKELCSYSFKCSNCKGNHQVDSNLYLFWKYKFNREWQTKKYQEIHDNRRKLICLNISSG